jgi:hypothetical protein
MATENSLKSVTFEAAGDLSAKQYHFVDINAAKRVAAVAVLGAMADGVLQDTPDAAGRAACVAIGGKTKIVFGGTVAAGADIAASAAGAAVTAVAGNIILGTCAEGGSAGHIGSMIFQPRGPAV